MAVAVPVSDNMTAADVAGHRMSAHCVARRRMSGACMIIWMAGGYRIRRHWHATEPGRSSESDECFMKHLILLIWLKQKICCEENDNASRYQELHAIGTR
jgi:hypothetical protein